MHADTNSDIMVEAAKRGLPVERGLQAFAVIGAAVGAVDDGIVEAGSAGRQAVLGRIGHRVGQHGGNSRIAARARTIGADTLQLVPVAGKVVMIGNCRQVQRWQEFNLVGQLEQLILAPEFIIRARIIAAIGVGLEIFQRQAEIGLVGGLFARLVFQLDALRHRAVILVRADFQHQIISVEARRPAIVQLLEPVSLVGEHFDQAAQFPACADLRPSARPGMDPLAIIGAKECLCKSGRLFRHWRREQVQCAARRARTIQDRGGPLGHFHGAHPRCCREIIGGRRGVGRRRDRHAVFHQHDTGRAIRARPAQADIRPQAITVLFLDVHARHDAQDALDIALGLRRQVSIRQEGDRPGHFVHRIRRACHDNRRQHPVRVLLTRRGGIVSIR